MEEQLSGTLDVCTCPPRRVELDAVEGELDELRYYPDQISERQTRLTRACRSNLILVCSSRSEAEQVGQEIPTLVRYEPCRILVFVLDENDRSNNLETEVCTYIGEERQVLGEQVTIRAGAAAARRSLTVTPALLIPGLHTALWWIPRVPPAPTGELFHVLSEMAHQLLYDSFGWTNVADGMAAMADWITNAPAEKALFDLGWHRLDPWRQMLNEALDPTVAGQASQTLQDLTIRHGAGALAPALLFVAWSAQSFGFGLSTTTFNMVAEIDWLSNVTRKPLKVKLQRASPRHCEISGIDVSWSESATSRAAHFFRARPDRQMVIYQSATDYSQAIMLPWESRPAAIAAQLASPARNPDFIAALMLARTIAEFRFD